MKQASLLTERELSLHLEELLAQRGLKLLAQQVRIGSFRIDALARATSDDSLVVVEVKTTRWCGTLAQLLLYPRALRRALEAEGLEARPARSLLITTYLDTGLIDVVDNHGLAEVIDLAICVGSTEEGLRLVDVGHPDAKSVLWDQAEGARDSAKLRNCLSRPMLVQERGQVLRFPHVFHGVSVF